MLKIKFSSPYWEKLSKKEQSEFEKLVNKPKKRKYLDILSALIEIDKNKKCFMYKYKFPEGILKRFPNQVLPIKKMVKGKFWFHLYSAHGISPEDFLGFIK